MIMSDFFVLLYIFTFIGGSVFSTIVTIFYIKDKNQTYGALVGFSIAFLLYSIFEFLLCYMVNINQGEAFIPYIINLSDACYYVFILFWVKLIFLLFGKFTPLSFRALVFITIPYAIITQILALRLSEYNQEIDAFSINLGVEQSFLIAINAIYSLILVYIGIMCIYKGVKAIKVKSINKVYLILPFSFICYVFWIMKWDYYIVSGSAERGMDLTITDPLVSIYVFACIIVTYCIYKDNRNSSAIIESFTLQKQFEEWGLTQREIEVAQLVASGNGNQQIAEILFISEHTVKRHLNNIFKKTECKGRFELMSTMKDKQK